MRRTVFLLLASCCLIKAEYSPRCSNNTESRLALSPSRDGVEGRYALEWCTEADSAVTRWELTVRYNEQRPQNQCLNYKVMQTGLKHSSIDETVTINSTCSNVCFETNLDLIFNGTCYHIKTRLFRKSMSSRPYDILYYALNPYTKEHFTSSNVTVNLESNYEDLKMTWFLGTIPVTDYEMNLYDEDRKQWKDIFNDCRVEGASQSEVVCRLRAPYGCYMVYLKFLAPWTVSSLFSKFININHHFCHNPSKAMNVTTSDPIEDTTELAVWWVGGCLALVAFFAVIIIIVWRLKGDADLKKRIRDHWLSRKDREPHVRPFHNSKIIVLLYARDCAPLMRAAALLRALLHRATGSQVIDLYTSDTVSAAAPASAEWVRSVLRSDDARVLLLQSPAAESLFCASLDTDSPSHPTLSAPLIGRRVVYLEPHPSDNSFALALRLLSETAHEHPQPYRKYYVAEISGLKADIVKGITPLRRYSLPEATTVLLRDLAPSIASSVTDDQALVDLHQQFSAAVEELKAFIQTNPDYLSEELLYI